MTHKLWMYQNLDVQICPAHFSVQLCVLTWHIETLLKKITTLTIFIDNSSHMWCEAPTAYTLRLSLLLQRCFFWFLSDWQFFSLKITFAPCICDKVRRWNLTPLMMLPRSHSLLVIGQRVSCPLQYSGTGSDMRPLYMLRWWQVQGWCWWAVSHHTVLGMWGHSYMISCQHGSSLLA